MTSTRLAGSPAHRSVLTARAAVIRAPQQATIVEVPLRDPGPGEVRLRIEGCGICGSNLPVWQGREWFDYPQPAGTPGHEGWGVVDAVGDGVRDLRRGQRVAALSHRAFAEYDVAPASAVVPLPESLGSEPFPGEALGCAMNVFRRSGIASGSTVAVIGVGFLGALLVQLAARAGARVIAISRRPFALDMARQCGATETIPLQDHRPIIEQVRTLTDGALCDVVIEAVGLQSPLDLAGELTRERGRLVIAGFHQDGRRRVSMSLWNWRGLDVINAHEREPAMYVRGMRDAASAVQAGFLEPSALYTHRFPLGEIDRAFTALRERPDGFMKALVMP